MAKPEFVNRWRHKRLLAESPRRQDLLISHLRAWVYVKGPFQRSSFCRGMGDICHRGNCYFHCQDRQPRLSTRRVPQRTYWKDGLLQDVFLALETRCGQKAKCHCSTHSRLGSCFAMERHWKSTAVWVSTVPWCASLGVINIHGASDHLKQWGDNESSGVSIDPLECP